MNKIVSIFDELTEIRSKQNDSKEHEEKMTSCLQRARELLFCLKKDSTKKK
jgi:hypothetical protein